MAAPPSRLTVLIAGGCVLVWLGIVVASVIIDDYTALTAITPIIAIAAGYVFGFGGTKKEEAE